MTTKLFEINMNGDSPFQVFDGLGNVMFDARYAALKVAQVGSVSVGENNSNNNTAVYADVILSRSRPGGAPLYFAMGFSGGMYTNYNKKYCPPSLSYINDGVSQKLYGYWTAGYSDRLRIGNQSQHFHYLNTDIAGNLTAWYCILDNSVSI